jgi:hypothetical protein
LPSSSLSIDRRELAKDHPQTVAVSLRKVGPLALAEHRKQEEGHVITRVVRNDAVAATFALASTRIFLAPPAPLITSPVVGVRAKTEMTSWRSPSVIPA